MRRHIQHISCLTTRYREQAHSHIGFMFTADYVHDRITCELPGINADPAIPRG